MLETAFRDLIVFLQSRSWRDVLDVVVVAFLAYRLLLLIRGTRAVQLIAGLGVLALVGLAAQALRLQLTYYIFSNLAPALLIGVVILFQPELRRALDRVGRVGFLGRPLAHYNLQLFSRLIEQVVHGVIRLSEKKVGALIVFERSVGLENYALTGVRLNAEVTAEVLEAIFFPRSPLHDGAVIIRGNQIVAAGCLLPLTDEVATKGRMGTRHRAALSLSLESDAAIVVISEETGTISLVQDGNLRKVEPEALRQMLHNLLLKTESARVPKIFSRRRRPAAASAPGPEPEVKAADHEPVTSEGTDEQVEATEPPAAEPEVAEPPVGVPHKASSKATP